MGLVIMLLLIPIGIAGVIISNKLSNKMHSEFMKASGLGDSLNQKFDEMNAEGLKKLDQMLAEGKITQEQYEKRKRNLMSTNYDFNK